MRFLILCLLIFTVTATPAQKLKTVVLDAGHGGHDTGALGKNSREKDITLSIVLKLRDYIQQNMKDVKVVLTRDDDTFVELHRRARIANEKKADMFISVHCNSTHSPAVFGAETFVMGLHKSQANLAVAKAENAAILLEDDYVEKYDGFDPNSPEGNIFFNMIQNAFLDNSLAFAGKVQHQFVDNLKLFDRGVKQAGFLVLYKTAMPGVLIETGFISNSREEKFLLSDKGQDQVAYAIYKALREYKNQIENKPAEPQQEDTLFITKQVKEGDKNATNSNSVPDATVAETPNPDAVAFRVQFAIYPDLKPIDSKLFIGIKDVRVYFHNGSHKYTAGNFDNMDAALLLRKEMIANGYKDAFIVAFKGKNRITIEEAKRLTGKK